MVDIKQTLELYLESVGQIEFTVYQENVMREIRSSYNGEHSEVIDNWLGYGGFYNCLGNDLYDYNGKIIKKGNEIIAFVSLNGPFEGEFESIEFILDQDYFSNLKIEIPEIQEFDHSSLLVSFDYCEDEGFVGFTATYYDGDTIVEIERLMNKVQLLSFQNFYKTRIHSNLQRLDLHENIKQYWSANCHENHLRFHIHSEFIEITNIDYSIGNNT